MDILWKENHKMSANEIAQTTEGLSIYTVSQVLQHLLSIGYVKVSGIGKNKKSIARLYSPCISESEYISSFIKKETFEELTLHFIQNNDDLESIIKLEKLIEQKKKELNQKV